MLRDQNAADALDSDCRSEFDREKISAYRQGTAEPFHFPDLPRSPLETRGFRALGPNPHTIVGFVFLVLPFQIIMEDHKLNTLLLKLHIKLQDLTSREEGQDMVEYALVCALLGLLQGCSCVSGGGDSCIEIRETHQP